MSENYLEIQLDQQPIELYKLLKIADLVTGGGEAKVVISEGYVLLNGEVAYQKRKKVSLGSDFAFSLTPRRMASRHSHDLRLKKACICRV